MFSVIFEVHPNKANWNDYLDNAKMLRHIRYKSLTRREAPGLRR